MHAEYGGRRVETSLWFLLPETHVYYVMIGFFTPTMGAPSTCDAPIALKRDRRLATIRPSTAVIGGTTRSVRS